MIGLRDLRVPPGATWATCGSVVVPLVEEYSIAADCLRGRRDRAAIVEAQGGDLRTTTYDELDDLSSRFASFLRDSGVVPGDRVGIKLSQSADMAVTVLGALRAGAVVVPLSNVLGEAALRHRLEDSAPRIVVAAGSDAEVSLLSEASVALVATQRGRHAPVLEDVLRSASPAADARLAPSDPALLLYTSGTTGPSKGVLQAQRFVLGHHAIDVAFDRIRDDDVAYTPVDWTWAGGLMLGLLVPLAHGLTVVAHREPRFDPAQALDLIRRSGASIGLMPPTVLRMLRAAGVVTRESVARTRLRCFITGAEAVEPELIAWGDEVGITINNAYGQTEANAIVGHSAALGPLDPASMGRPYPGHRVGVLDDHLQPLGPGEAGQLAVRADDPVCMLGYWNNAEATAKKMRDGWLLTGDTVQWNDDGTLRFRGRSDDIIKSGAYRLGPAEIEGAILRLDVVTECAAVGLPDPIRGQIVAAVVTLREGTTADPALFDSIRDAVRTSVGSHAYPRRIEVVDRMPKTTTNKIDRAALRASLSEGARA